MANTAPFGELLSSAWSLVRQRMNVLLPGVILFTVLTVLLQIPLADMEEEGARVAPEQMGIGVVASLASALVGVIGYLYYLLAVTGGEQSVATILKKTLPRIFPFIGLSILILLRTFTWLSILGGIMVAYAGYAMYAGGPAAGVFMPIGVLLILAGIVCGVVFGPRYMLAPVLWVTENLGVNAAVKRSYDVSKGYWGKIIGNVLLVALIFLVIMIGVGIVAGMLGGIGGSMGGPVGELLVAGLLTTFFAQFYNVVLISFLLKLASTIVGGARSASIAPKAPSAPKPVKAAAPAPAASKTPAKKALAKKAPAKKSAAKKKSR